MATSPIQTTLDTGRSVRLETMLAPSLLELELKTILALIDSAIADQPNEEVSANLYSSRLHMVRAIKEAA